MPVITVLVASPERGARKACQDLLIGHAGVRMVGEARSGFQILAVVGTVKPRVLLLDLLLSRANGRSLIPAIRQKHAGTHVIVLTQPPAEAQTLDALSLGARGCLAWDALPRFLLPAVKAVDSGEAWVPRKMVAQLMGRLVALYDSGGSGSSRTARAAPA